MIGEIPLELGNLARLTELWLDGKQLCGGIPPESGNLANLARLDLDDNQLCGGIPPELDNLANPTSLSLSSNQSSGCVPSNLSGQVSTIEIDGHSARDSQAHPAYRRDKFSAERTRGEAPCSLGAPQHPSLHWCRDMPAQARGLLKCQHSYGGRREKSARGRPDKWTPSGNQPRRLSSG